MLFSNDELKNMEQNICHSKKLQYGDLEKKLNYVQVDAINLHRTK